MKKNKVKLKRNLYLLLIIFMVNMTSGIFAQDESNYLNNPNYKKMMDLYNSYPTRQANIVMLGDSHTAGANWGELLGRKDVVGRGIPSDVTKGMLARLSDVLKLKPKVVFILAGVNDIYNWIPATQVFDTYKRIIERLRTRGVIPVVQSAIYAGKDWGKEWIENNNPGMKPIDVNRGRNNEIRNLNRLLRNYCNKNKLKYVEIVSKLSTKDGFLKKTYTWDNLHLNSKGYKIWAREVNKALKSLGY